MEVKKINFIEKFLSLIFPPACGMCGEIYNSYICKYCYDYLKKREINKLNIYNDKNFSEHFWIYEYKDEVRSKLIDYKFNGKAYLYRTFVELILSNDKAMNFVNSFDVAIPVPIHKKRLKDRGYNQSELILKAVCKNAENILFRNDVLVKNNNIKPQSTLSKADREQNILGVYELSKTEYFYNKSILLFDDIYTTGSTVNECSKILKNTNCKKIGIFTLVKD